ncbi:MAG: GntR family transcriptional regulator [Alphaproteobacteria bacterium]
MEDLQTNYSAESSAPDDPATAAGTLPIYRMTYEIIAFNIRQEVIPAGATLLVAHIAEKFRISRAPVYQALELLAADGLIRKAIGHGYLVTGKHDTPLPAIKFDLDATTLRLPESLQDHAAGEPLRSVPIWRTIYDEVEQVIVERAVHGRFRLLEARLASHYGVSRTVAKEVIAQLQMNGLVEHAANSQWFGVPMTKQAVTDRYDLRLLLEPYALRLAAPHLTAEFLRPKLARVAMEIQRFPDAPSSDSMRLEWDLHVDCLAPCGNDELMRVLQRSQNYPIVNHAQFARTFSGAVPHHYAQEHQEILEYLAAREIDAAVHSLQAHLKSACEKTLKRLEIMANQEIGGPISYILPAN